LRVKNTKEHTGGMTGPQADRLRMETERKLSGWGERKKKKQLDRITETVGC
jgi:hypothetical protein